MAGAPLLLQQSAWHEADAKRHSFHLTKHIEPLLLGSGS